MHRLVDFSHPSHLKHLFPPRPTVLHAELRHLWLWSTAGNINTVHVPSWSLTLCPCQHLAHFNDESRPLQQRLAKALSSAADDTIFLHVLSNERGITVLINAGLGG